MPFEEALAVRIRECLARHPGIEERTLFGCACFLVGGNVVVGAWRDSLITRIGPEAYDDALLEPHVSEFDITGRPMRGWVVVDPEGVEDDERLNDWIQRALRFGSRPPAERARGRG